jgi:hypothetical protein
MWNRVNLKTGKAVWPGYHWNKSKEVCREMEKELGLMTPTPRRGKKVWATTVQAGPGGHAKRTSRGHPKTYQPELRKMA